MKEKFFKSIDYEGLEENYYERLNSKKYLLRYWFHNSRNEKINTLVKKYYRPSQVIVDLGCGNVLWNQNLLPVVGVDINENFLNFSFDRKRISQKVLADLHHTTLPDNYADIIVITEVLEHLSDNDTTIKEIYRILKPGGVVICSVPYDTNISLWKPLFFLQCFYRGTIKKEPYYQQQCGHINHFSPRSISQLFTRHQFTQLAQANHFFLTIFSIFKK